MDTAAIRIRSLSGTTAAPEPRLTCLFPLSRFLRVAVASPFNERVPADFPFNIKPLRKK